jgi:hypothetical protein
MQVKNADLFNQCGNSIIMSMWFTVIVPSASHLVQLTIPLNSQLSHMSFPSFILDQHRKLLEEVRILDV